MVIGATNANELFTPGEDPLGRQVPIGGHAFQVKGILKKDKLLLPGEKPPKWWTE